MSQVAAMLNYGEMQILENFKNTLPYRLYSTLINVTFDAMETLERNSDCIDRLTLLASDMKMTMDRKQSPYKPKIYQGRSRNQNRNRQNFAPRNRSFSRGRNQRNYNNRNNSRPNYGNKLRGRWNNHRLGDRSNNYQNSNR